MNELTKRKIQFEGTVNSRDLGGIPISAKNETKYNSFIRSDSIDTFSEKDWIKLKTYGVQTVVDLRFKREKNCDAAVRPKDVKTISISLDGDEDSDFWNYWKRDGRWATPLYYKAHLERFPNIMVSILSKMASIDQGGILFHCASGRDRTGLITLVLLKLAGVPTTEIAADHSLSHNCLSKLYAKRGETDQKILINRLLAEEGKTTQNIFEDIFESLDIKQLLLKNGLTQEEITILTSRLT